MAPRSTTETFFFFGDSLTLASMTMPCPAAGSAALCCWVPSRLVRYAARHLLQSGRAPPYLHGHRRPLAGRSGVPPDPRHHQPSGLLPGVVDMSPAQMRPVDEVCATVMQMLDQASALGPVLLICPPPVKEPAMSQRIASLCEPM
mgnify:CR=1 FL=1